MEPPHPPLRTLPDHLWHAVKVVCGLLLFIRVTQFYLSHLIADTTPLTAMTFVGLFLIALGGGLRLWHYFLLKKALGNIYRPSFLLKTGGLFSLVRHPVYLGDIVLFWGLYVIAPDRVSAAIFFVGFIALLRQTTTEEKVLSALFGEEYQEWFKRTRYMIPYIF